MANTKKKDKKDKKGKKEEPAAAPEPEPEPEPAANPTTDACKDCYFMPCSEHCIGDDSARTTCQDCYKVLCCQHSRPLATAGAAEAAYAAMHIPLQRYNEQTNTKTYKHAIQTTLVAV